MIAVEIREADFDVGAEYNHIKESATGAGAVVFFVGLVRDLYVADDPTETVDYIELQHYSGMTETLCEQICREAADRFSVEHIRVVHRVGKLKGGDQIVFVASASPHRKSAFDAAQYVMDYLKTRATLWKKEVGTRGDNWVGMKSSDKEAVVRWQTPESAPRKPIG